MRLFLTFFGNVIEYFETGTGCGQMIMPGVVRVLLDEYGFRGAALIMGALAFHGLVGSALYQPVEWHMKRASGSCYNEKRMLLQPCRHSANKQAYHEVVTTDAEYDDDDDSKNILATSDTMSIDSEAVLIRTPSWKERISKALDLDLLFDMQFVSIAIGLSLGKYCCDFVRHINQIEPLFSCSLYGVNQFFHASPIFFASELTLI